MRGVLSPRSPTAEASRLEREMVKVRIFPGVLRLGMP